MKLDTDMLAYYALRAADYEQVYAKPERQLDLPNLRAWISTTLAGHRVIELACGTGYWTVAVAEQALTVLATDANAPMLAIAKAKKLPTEKVEFAIMDALHPSIKQPAETPFTACFAAFWWSHIKREEQDQFMQQLRHQLGTDTLFVLVDNAYVDGSSTTIARTDLQGNTFQIRTLADGQRFEVLKNFPSDSALRKRLAAHLKDIRIQRLEHYWMLSGRLR